MSKRPFRRTLATLLAASALLATAAPAVADDDDDGGFLTAEPSLLDLAPGVEGSVTPIISSGDTIGDFLFEGLPDGIGLAPGEDDTVDVYVAHEQTTIPFRGTADFQSASISKLVLSIGDVDDDDEDGDDEDDGEQATGVLEAYVPLGPDAEFKRFCSAFMASEEEGFDGYVFLTGEETSNSGIPGNSYAAADPFYGDGTRQGGLAVALDTETGESVAIPGMGRLNHETALAVPGFDQIVILTTDDTFAAGTSQLYMYVAEDQDALMNDEGTLYALRVTHDNGAAVDATDPFNGANDYIDLGVDDDFRAEFIEVPEDIAKGLGTDASPQAQLENWSNDNNVFQWIRLEDAAYDPNDPTRVFIADTGASRITPDPATGRMHRPRGEQNLAPNGRIVELVFDEDDPTVVESLSVFADGDAPGSDVYVPFTAPDNIDTSEKSLMVQEDADNARIWQGSIDDDDDWRVVATVNDPDGESSGIVDASDYWGEGAWILDVQGHGTWIASNPLPDGTIQKREAGQVLLMIIEDS